MENKYQKLNELNWILGDPLPKLSISGNADRCHSLDHLSENQTKTVTDFVRDIGDNARNQLARPCEYLAQTKHVISKLFDFFPTTWCDANAPGTELLRKESYFCTIFPEVELFYNDVDSSDSYELFFYVCFCGRDFPEESLWKSALKLEHQNTTFEKLEKFNFYDTTRHPNNPYQFSVKPVPSEIANYYALDENENQSFCNSDFMLAYFCNARSNFLGDSASGTPVYPPGLSDCLEYAIGNDELLKHFGTANDLRVPSAHTFDRENSDFLDAVLTPNTVSRMIDPCGEEMLINGQIFRNANRVEIGRLFSVRDGRKVGYNKLLKTLAPYRVRIKCSCSPYHNLDHVSEPFNYFATQSFQEQIRNLLSDPSKPSKLAPEDRVEKSSELEKISQVYEEDDFLRRVFTETELQEIDLAHMQIPTNYQQMSKSEVNYALDNFRKNSTRDYGNARTKRRKLTTNKRTKPIATNNRTKPIKKKNVKKKPEESKAQLKLTNYFENE